MPRVIEDCPYFLIEEFAVSRSHPELVEPVPPFYRSYVEELVREVLWPLRVKLDMPFYIQSGYRSRALNKAVGGSPTSQHLKAQAADVSCGNPELLFRTAMRMAAEGHITPGQMIYYPARRFVHCAIRGNVFPTASFHVHEPTKGHTYAHVLDEDELGGFLA